VRAARVRASAADPAAVLPHLRGAAHNRNVRLTGLPVRADGSGAAAAGHAGSEAAEYLPATAAAARLIRAGLEPVTVAAVLGREDATTTHRIYAHLLGRKRTDAAVRGRAGGKSARRSAVSPVTLSAPPHQDKQRWRPAVAGLHRDVPFLPVLGQLERGRRGVVHVVRWDIRVRRTRRSCCRRRCSALPHHRRAVHRR
jgi:hypothetical protein